MITVKKNIRKPSADEKLEEARLRILLNEYAEQEAQKYIKEFEEIKDLPQYQPSPELDKKINEKLKKAVLREKVKKIRQTTVRVIAQVAAVILICIGMATSVTFAVEPFRNGFINFMMSIKEKYTAIDDSGKVLQNINDYWQGIYYPYYVPEGYEINIISNSKHEQYITYMNETGERITFYISNDDHPFNIDTENFSRIDDMIINGNKAMLVEKDGVISITIFVGDDIITIKGTLPEAEIVKIAENVKFTK